MEIIRLMTKSIFKRWKVDYVAMILLRTISENRKRIGNLI